MTFEVEYLCPPISMCRDGAISHDSLHLLHKERTKTIKLIEKEIIIAKDGKLPTDFREAFGRKARVAVYLQEDEQRKTEGADVLSDLDGKIQAFRDIDDPVAFQRNLRAEWDRGWEK